jgi:hypothetical protein
MVELFLNENPCIKKTFSLGKRENIFVRRVQTTRKIMGFEIKKKKKIYIYMYIRSRQRCVDLDFLA